MTDLRQAVDVYPRLRRSLGHQMAEAAYLLPDFVGFMDSRGEQTVTIAAALDWMKTREPEVITTVSPRRITAVRGFARYLSGIDPATEVPPLGLVPYNRRRGQIFLYTDADIAAIMAAAKETIPQPLRAATYHTLIGLLAASGLRIGEAIKLDRDDIDWTEGVLHIRESKFGKSRLVPLHASTIKILSNYDERRDRLFPKRKTPYFFCSRYDGRLDEGQIRRVFYVISRQIGIRGASASRGPRLHDFRHRFAVQTLLRWHYNGDDVQQRLPILSTYLGHGHVTDTYWYVTGTPELMAAVGQRLEKRWEGI